METSITLIKQFNIQLIVISCLYDITLYPHWTSGLENGWMIQCQVPSSGHLA